MLQKIHRKFRDISVGPVEFLVFGGVPPTNLYNILDD